MQVASIFTDNAALLMIPVSSGAGFEGVISRRDLFSRHLARKFAVELFGNKPIHLLINTQPITMSPDMDINSALLHLLELNPELDEDSFPVLDKGNCVGIVHVAELIMVISKVQASLLNKLEVLSARIREEVDKARQIQQDLLPPSSFKFAGTVLDAVHRAPALRPHVAVALAGHAARSLREPELLAAWRPLCEGGITDLSLLRAWLDAELAAGSGDAEAGCAAVAAARDRLDHAPDPVTALLLREYLDELDAQIAGLPGTPAPVKLA